MKCRYEERVIKIDIFEGVSLRCVSLSTTTKEVYDTRGKKSIETKDKRELILSQNDCVSERVFVVLIKSVTTLYIRL